MKRLLLVLFIPVLAACSFHQPMHQAKKENAEAAKYNVQLGLAYLKQGDNERAKNKLLRALEQAPKSDQAYGAMAYFLERTGQVSIAEKYYKKAISYAQHPGPSYNNFGAFLCRKKQYQDADAYFMKAVKDKQYIRVAEAYENAGICSAENHQYERAEKYFLLALERDQNRAISLYELADLNYKNKHYKRAEQYLQSYLQVAPVGPSASLLGLHLAHKTGNKNAEAKFAVLLKSKFSNSTRYKHNKEIAS